jgi:hypothetical protein
MTLYIMLAKVTCRISYSKRKESGQSEDKYYNKSMLHTRHIRQPTEIISATGGKSSNVNASAQNKKPYPCVHTSWTTVFSRSRCPLAGSLCLQLLKNQHQTGIQPRYRSQLLLHKKIKPSDQGTSLWS